MYLLQHQQREPMALLLGGKNAFGDARLGFTALTLASCSANCEWKCSKRVRLLSYSVPCDSRGMLSHHRLYCVKLGQLVSQFFVSARQTPCGSLCVHTKTGGVRSRSPHTAEHCTIIIQNMYNVYLGIQMYIMFLRGRHASQMSCRNLQQTSCAWQLVYIRCEIRGVTVCHGHTLGIGRHTDREVCVSECFWANDIRKACP